MNANYACKSAEHGIARRQFLGTVAAAGAATVTGGLGVFTNPAIAKQLQSDQKRIVVFNMASASGEFVKSLSAKGRIVVTATRNGQETNATRFAGFLITALNATDGDTDQDGHTH